MPRHSRLPPLAAAFLAAAAAAQSPAPAPSGAEQGTAAAPLAYRSALAGYEAFSEESVISWREANDTVGRIGGWRAYAREGARPASPPGGAATTPPSGRAPGEKVPERPAAAPAGSVPPAAPAPAAPAPAGGHGGHQH